MGKFLIFAAIVVAGVLAEPESDPQYYYNHFSGYRYPTTYSSWSFTPYHNNYYGMRRFYKREAEAEPEAETEPESDAQYYNYYGMTTPYSGYMNQWNRFSYNNRFGYNNYNTYSYNPYYQRRYVREAEAEPEAQYYNSY